MTISMTTMWLIVLIISVVVELVTLDLVSIWFCIGAIASFVLALYKVNSNIQIAIFIIVSLASFIVTRPLADKFLRGNVVKTNADRIIGKKSVVLKEITPNTRGEIQVLGKIWTAVSLDSQSIKVGEEVEVIAIEGVKAVVRKIN